ncbi:ATPase, AAA-type, core [Corchorus capsularis]|uniref:ATPase, AAA-type, core n=1 Tax=Corchorus capsularis TaxID=210143 RepID=A0A1R3H7E7_COCAP|nr:ATPase, AAA-type, core [Corchorus capsularis]
MHYAADGFGFRRSEAYRAIENYLNSKSTEQASKLKANVFKDGKCIVRHMEDHEEVSDVFQGIKLSWSKVKSIPRAQVISLYASATEKRYYKLSFHKRYRDQITKNYLKFVLEKGKEIAAKNRQRKLYTNVSGQSYSSRSRKNMWSHVVFEHPASFDTLAMDPVKKKEIMDELVNFSQSKDYYARIGKAWKRGYLLYGPPGTGKSTMIAAIANFLSYDIYDLELTAVADNTDLRNLLIQTSSKSILVIEDIDSLDIASQRRKIGKKKEAKEKKTSAMEEEEDKSSLRTAKEEARNKAEEEE